MKTQSLRATAIEWIDAEFAQFLRDIGQKNASAAVRSCIDLALLLEAISPDDHAHYRARVSQAYNDFNSQGAAA